MNKLKPYEKYKPSGIAWLGDIPEHWEISKAKHILFQKKKTLNPKLNCGSISFGNIVFKDNERVPLETKATYQELLNGEFLINPLNLNFDLKSLRTGLSTIDVVVSTGYIVLQNNPKFNKKYLKWLLHQFDVSFMKTLGDGVRQTLSYNDFKNTDFPYIPFNEQTAIANFLDYKTAKIDRFIRKKKQLIKLLNEQKAGIINYAVTKGLNPIAETKPSGIDWLGDIPEHWEVRKLKYVAEFQSGEMITSETISQKGEFPVFGGGGFRGYTNNYTNDGNHVLIGRQGALCGNIKYASGKFWASEHSIVTYPKIEIENVYLGEILTICKLGKLSQTAAQPGIAIGQIKNVSIPLPPLTEQQLIVSHVEKETTIVNQTISTIEKEIALVQEYRTALIAEAVTGKIDVRSYAIPDYSEDETYEELEEKLNMVAEDGEDYVTIED